MQIEHEVVCVNVRESKDLAKHEFNASEAKQACIKSSFFSTVTYGTTNNAIPHKTPWTSGKCVHAARNCLVCTEKTTYIFLNYSNLVLNYFA